MDGCAEFGIRAGIFTGTAVFSVESGAAEFDTLLGFFNAVMMHPVPFPADRYAVITDREIILVLEFCAPFDIEVNERCNAVVFAGDEVLLTVIDSTKKELKNLQIQIENEIEKSKSELIFTDLKKTLSNLSEAWEYMTPKEQKVIVNECINKIFLTDERVHVDYKFSNAKEQ